MPLHNLILIRKGSEADWINSGAVLASGEPGFDTTNGVLKIGNGSSTWANLLNKAVFSDTDIKNSLIVGSSSSSPFLFANSSGISIGKNNPAYNLDVVGTGNFSQNLLVNGTGVSLVGHTHTIQDIAIPGIEGETLSSLDNFFIGRVLGGSLTDAVINDGGIDAVAINDFNATVSGLLPTIANSGDNRVLTSTGTSTGINGESNLTFDGSSLKIGNPNPAIVGTLVVNGNIVTAAQSVISSIFSIYGNTNNRLEFQNNSLSLTTSADSVNHAFPYFSGSSRINRMIITSSGVGIGTDIPVSRLDVSGVITASGGNSANWNAAHSWGNHAAVGYAPLNSPTLTGVPLTPTAASGTNTNQIASTAFVRTEISNLVASAPGTLDTLNELATALGNDPNFATTVTNNITGRVSKSGDTMTGTLNAPTGIFSGNVQISSQTASTIAGFDSNKNVTSLSTGTYPSLTELSYVKGVTSNIQTQLNSKQSTLTDPVTGTGTLNYVSKWTGSTTQGNSIIFDNGTNVGIGTSSPSCRLEVAASGTASLDIAHFSNSNGIEKAKLSLSSAGDGTFSLIDAGNTTDIFFTSNSSTASYINAGNFGIGTTSPTTKLEVAGNINIGFPNENINRSLTIHSSNASNKSAVLSHDGNGLTIGYNVANQSLNLGTSVSRWINGIGYWGGSHSFFGNSADNPLVLVNGSTGDVGIGTSTPEYKLQVNGSFGATTKSFRIDHPSKQNYTLEYGSLESPYHGVRLTGRGVVVKGSGVVQLPDYLKNLIHDDETINIQITNIKHGKTIYVDKIDLNNDQFTVKVDRAKTLGELEFFWTFTGIRKDVDHLIVEREK